MKDFTKHQLYSVLVIVLLGVSYYFLFSYITEKKEVKDDISVAVPKIEPVIKEVVTVPKSETATREVITSKTVKPSKVQEQVEKPEEKKEIVVAVPEKVTKYKKQLILDGDEPIEYLESLNEFNKLSKDLDNDF